jgi:hypothetical protein
VNASNSMDDIGAAPRLNTGATMPSLPGVRPALTSERRGDDIAIGAFGESRRQSADDAGDRNAKPMKRKNET